MNKSSQSPRTAVESAGSILRAERAAKGIPLELVAHDLRMRPQQVVDLEQDDHARLPNSSYVRLLILYYARYLNIAASRMEPHLPERSAFQSKGYQSVCHTLATEPQPRRKAAEFRPSSLPKRVFPAISTCCIAIITIAIGIGLYLSYRHSREDQNRMIPPPPPSAAQTEASITKPSRGALETIKAFDAALLEQVPRMTAVNPPPLKVTRDGDLEKKAELVRNASKMRFLSPFPNTTPQAGILVPSGTARISPQ